MVTIPFCPAPVCGSVAAEGFVGAPGTVVVVSSPAPDPTAVVDDGPGSVVGPLTVLVVVAPVVDEGPGSDVVVDGGRVDVGGTVVVIGGSVVVIGGTVVVVDGVVVVVVVVEAGGAASWMTKSTPLTSPVVESAGCVDGPTTW